MKQYRYPFLILLFALFVGTLLIVGPIPQDLAYHDFADQRTILGIPNFWDVMSNVPMFFVGCYAFWYSFQYWSYRPDLVAKLIPVVLGFGIFITSFGSGYYHWAPDNNTLIWDRLPMTLMFMPLFSLLIYDFLGKQQGKIAFWLLVPLGIFSIFYWQYTETIGQGDLRFYAFVQFFPMLIAPFILWLFPKKTNYVRYIVYILAWYIVAKICEHFDKIIFEYVFWSGHTLKHFVGAISLIYVIKLVKAWEEQFKLDTGQNSFFL